MRHFAVCVMLNLLHYVILA